MKNILNSQAYRWNSSVSDILYIKMTCIDHTIEVSDDFA